MATMADASLPLALELARADYLEAKSQVMFALLERNAAAEKESVIELTRKAEAYIRLLERRR